MKNINIICSTYKNTLLNKITILWWSQLLAGQIKNCPARLAEKILTVEPWNSEWGDKKPHAMCRGLSEIYHKPQNRTENPVLPESAANWRKYEKYGMRVHFLWKLIWSKVEIYIKKYMAKSVNQPMWTSLGVTIDKKWHTVLNVNYAILPNLCQLCTRTFHLQAAA